MPDDDKAGNPASSIRNPLLPDSMGEGETETTTRDELSLLRLFAGKRADMFARVYEGQVKWADKAFRKSLSPGQRIKFSWKHSKYNWPVFFAGPVWFFYRKLWLEGAAMIAIPIVLIVAFPSLDKVQFGISTLLAFYANGYYVWRARKRIAAIEADGGPVEERNRLIRARGGTSIAGLILGLVLVAGIIGLSIYGIQKEFAARRSAQILPGCDTPDVRKTTQNLVFSNLKSRSIPTTGISLSGFREVNATPEMRTCTMTLKAPGEEAAFHLQVSWRNREKREFQVGIVRAPN
jgi:hypothetical protein